MSDAVTRHVRDEAAFVLFSGAAASAPAARIFLTCEHASLALPAPWGPAWPPADAARIVGTHWSVDIGAEQLARDLAVALACDGIAAKFSRLLCDANRPLDSDTLFRTVADGAPVALNEAHERTRRISTLYEPFHSAIDAYLGEHRVELIFSIHSYTDMYEGSKREVEVGVLYKEHDALALQMNERLRALSFDARLNEPWSGKAGFMHSADKHARAHGCQALMLEARQDLIVQPQWRAKLVHALTDILASTGFAV